MVVATTKNATTKNKQINPQFTSFVQTRLVVYMTIAHPPPPRWALPSREYICYLAVCPGELSHGPASEFYSAMPSCAHIIKMMFLSPHSSGLILCFLNFKLMFLVNIFSFSSYYGVLWPRSHAEFLTQQVGTRQLISLQDHNKKSKVTGRKLTPTSSLAILKYKSKNVLPIARQSIF